jgi:chromosome partitioning protein
MADSTINSVTSLKILRESYNGAVFNTLVPRNTDIRDAHFNKQDIFSYAPQSKSADAYNRLLSEIFNV